MVLQMAKRFLLGMVLVSEAALATSSPFSAAHANSIGPVGPPPTIVMCWDMPHNAQITLTTTYTITVSGRCFRGSSDDVAVYDITQARYLPSGNTWQTVTTDGHGKFSIVVPGARCYDRVEAIAYDTGWNSYTNQGNWQASVVQCPPK